MPPRFTARYPTSVTERWADSTVPDESIICTWTTNLALATDAVARGVTLQHRNPRSPDVERRRRPHHRAPPSRGDLTTGWVVNAAGLGADYLDQEFGYDRFHVTPRRGELLVYDKLARALIDKIVLPVPTARGKGVLVVTHHLRQRDAGPHRRGPARTAPRPPPPKPVLPSCSSKGRRALATAARRGSDGRPTPGCEQPPITATTSSNADARQRYVLVGGIRSTGLTSGMAVAEMSSSPSCNRPTNWAERRDRSAGTAADAQHRRGLPTALPGRRSASPPTPPTAPWSASANASRPARSATPTRSLIPPAGLDGLRRRTRAMNGRCQGFFCGAEVNALMHRHRQSPRPSAFAITPTENVG